MPISDYTHTLIVFNCLHRVQRRDLTVRRRFDATNKAFQECLLFWTSRRPDFSSSCCARNCCSIFLLILLITISSVACPEGKLRCVAPAKRKKERREQRLSVRFRRSAGKNYVLHFITAITASKSLKAAFVGVPAQLMEARTVLSTTRSTIPATKEPTDRPLAQSCPVTVRIST